MVYIALQSFNLQPKIGKSVKVKILKWDDKRLTTIQTPGFQYFSTLIVLDLIDFVCR